MPKPLPAVLLFAALAASLPLSLPAQSPGFDCTKATTPQEKAICASPELSKADAEMSVAYKAWLAAAPPTWQPEIRQNQRLWLRQRSSHCLKDDPNWNETVNQCLLGWESKRTDDLRGMVARKGEVAFVWRAITLKARDTGVLEYRTSSDNEENPGYGTMAASWPQAIANTSEWRAWNSAIEVAARKVLHDDVRLGQIEKSDDAWRALPDVDSDITVSVGFVDRQMATATIAYLADFHGAHPGHGTSEFNWLLQERRELKSSDVFRPQIYWLGELYNRTDKHLQSQLNQKGYDYKQWLKPGEVEKALRDVLIDPRSWQIDEKGITIVFNPYAVACYACTPEPFTMNWESLKPLLNPTFAIPTK